MPMPALLKVLFLRMFRRAECRIAITVTLLCCLIAFGETCFKFYGADVGELPSAAYAWAWNMDAMQVNASRVYLFFVMPVAAALVFADAARQDLRSGAACLLASRTSVTTCVLAYGITSFIGAFLLTFVALVLLQVLALVAFPVEGTFEGYLGMPMYLDLRTPGGLFAGIWNSSPYAYNIIFTCGAAHMRRLRADRSAHERFATGDFPHCSVLAVRDDSHVGGAASRRLGSPRRCVGQCRHGELSCYVGIPFLGVLLPDGHFVWDVGFHGHECCGRRAPADWMELGNCPGRRRLGGDRCPSWSACVVIAGFGRLALAGCG